MKEGVTKYAKNPWTQLVFVVVLLVAYWSWDIGFSHEEQAEVQQQMQPMQEQQSQQMVPLDTTRTLQDFHGFGDYSEHFVLPPSSSDSASDNAEEGSEVSSSPSDDLEALEWKFKFWDMILGHLASILGSLVALAVPAYNFWKQRNTTE